VHTKVWSKNTTGSHQLGGLDVAKWEGNRKVLCEVVRLDSSVF
jgi:hypothetical protein